MTRTARRTRRTQRTGAFHVVRHEGHAVEVRYIKNDDGKAYYHPYRSEPDMLLVTVDGRRAVLIIDRGDTPLWAREDEI